MERKKKKERRKNNAKFSGHYVYPRTETVCAHILRSHQFEKLESLTILTKLLGMVEVESGVKIGLPTV